MDASGNFPMRSFRNSIKGCFRRFSKDSSMFLWRTLQGFFQGLLTKISSRFLKESFQRFIQPIFHDFLHKLFEGFFLEFLLGFKNKFSWIYLGFFFSNDAQKHVGVLRRIPEKKNPEESRGEIHTEISITVFIVKFLQKLFESFLECRKHIWRNP